MKKWQNLKVVNTLGINMRGNRDGFLKYQNSRKPML